MGVLQGFWKKIISQLPIQKVLWSLLGELVGAMEQGAAMEPDHHRGQGLRAVQALILGAVDVEEQAVLLQAAAHPSWKNEASQTRRGRPVSNGARSRRFQLQRRVPFCQRCYLSVSRTRHSPLTRPRHLPPG